MAALGRAACFGDVPASDDRRANGAPALRMARRFRESHLPCGRARPGARRQIRKEPEGIAAVRLHRLRAGGGLGIRTPEGTLWPLTRLAGEHLRPLGQPSARRTRIAHSRPFDNRKFKQSQSRAPKPRELRKGGRLAREGIPPRRESCKDDCLVQGGNDPAARLRPLSRIRPLSRKTTQAPRRRPGAPGSAPTRTSQPDRRRAPARRWASGR